MHLHRLRIDSLPGIEPGFTFEPPGGGLVIVTGPNAVGKTSLARALGYLLRDAQASDPPGLHLEAELHSNEARWTVRRIGSQILWVRDGEPASRPALPGVGWFGLYRLSVENLLASDDTDAQLAGELRRQLRGGFDTRAPRIEINNRFAKRESKKLQDATAHRHRIEQEYKNLQREEAQLPELEERIEAAKAAGDEKERLTSALSLRESVAKLAECEAKLREFPSGMGALQGDELHRLEELEKKKAQLKDDLEGKRGEGAALQRGLEGTGLGQAQPGPEQMQTAEDWLRELDTKQAEWENTGKAVADADARMRDAVAEFEGTGEPPKLGRDDLRRVERVAAPLVNQRQLCDELKRGIDSAGTPPDEHEIELFQEGAAALRDWLRVDERVAVEAGRGVGRVVRIGLALGFAASAVAALATGILVAAGAGATDAAGFTYALAAMLGAFVAALSLLVAFFAERRQRSPSKLRRAEASRFHKTDLQPPPDWREDVVRAHLHSVIDKELQDLLKRRARASDRERLEGELEEAHKTLQELEDECAALAKELGFDPTLPLLAYERFVQLSMAFDKSRANRQARQAERECLATAMDDLTERVSGFLSAWWVAWGSDAPAGTREPGDPNRKPSIVLLRSTFNELRNRRDTAEKTLGNIKTNNDQIESLGEKIAEADESIENIYRRVGLQPGNRTALTERVERLDGWREVRNELERARGSEEQWRMKLQEHPDLTALADAGAVDKLQVRLEDAERRAGDHIGLVEERATIQTKLNKAGAEGDLESAAAAEERARAALADKREEAYLSCATQVLLDDVEADFHAEHEPDVLRRAKALFATATGHEFALELHSDDHFTARDNKQGRSRAVDELSSGTRMQLLLALRLAWTEAQEQGGEALPLFLDEALTTSDEDRFGVIAESLERLADTQHRQIFYLAARQHEAALWREATGTQPPVVNLAEVRFGQQGRSATDYQVERPQPLPAPEGRSAEEYALLLGVPPIDPRAPATSLHPFFLLRDDLDLLHHLLARWRILSLGQLESLLESNAAAQAFPDANAQGKLAGRCAAYRTWVEHWRRGRGRPIDLSVLEESGAVSGTFIDDTAKLAQDFDGNGQALIKALRAGVLRNFRRGKIDELENWLVDHGYIDERPLLTAEECRRGTLQQQATGTKTDVDDINEVLGWFEAGHRMASIRRSKESKHD